jgi:AraC family transcriptional regulator of adaptative response/methylated-DNA-[protein]-cysteine methyltransferase
MSGWQTRWNTLVTPGETGRTCGPAPKLSVCLQAISSVSSRVGPGISPKQYQASLAHAEAGDLLRQGLAFSTRHSRPACHRRPGCTILFIAHEALSPGEAKKGGDGARLTIGKAGTPFGTGVFLISPRGLCGLGFADDGVTEKTGFVHPGYTEDKVFTDMMARYANADFTRDDAEAKRWSGKVFGDGGEVPLAMYGTPFRRQVWRALLEIPTGETWTYGQVATSAGNPKAARAAGTAIGANTIAWLIPCHRALASDGRLHNYHWGTARKRAMLTYEKVHTAAH